MNGLYGYPMTGLVGLGQASKEEVEIGVTRVLSGEAYDDLMHLKKVNEENEKKLVAQDSTISKMTAGKDQAVAAWRAAMTLHNEALETQRQLFAKYNELAESIEKWSMGMAAPKRLSGLGYVQAIMVGAIIVAGGVALVMLINAVSELWATATGQTDRAKGYIEQLSDLMRQFGHTAVDTSKAVLWLFWSGVAAAVGYVAYNEWKRGKRGGSAVTPASSTALVPMKTIEAEVLA